MSDDKIQQAYELLAMLHTETVAELVETQRRMDAMSRCWWRMLKHRIKTVLGFNSAGE